jgi:hypothetical protein
VQKTLLGILKPPSFMPSAGCETEARQQQLIHPSSANPGNRFPLCLKLIQRTFVQMGHHPGKEAVA